MLLVEVTQIPKAFGTARVMPAKAGISATHTSLQSADEAATYAALNKKQTYFLDPDLRQGDDS